MYCSKFAIWPLEELISTLNFFFKLDTSLKVSYVTTTLFDQDFSTQLPLVSDSFVINIYIGII